MQSSIRTTLKYPFLRDLDLSESVILKLSLLLDRIIKGKSEVIQHPVLFRQNLQLIINDWDDIYNSKISLINNNLSDLEQKNRSKIGPRSIAKPWVDIKDVANSYFKKPEVNTISINAVDYVKQKRRLRPISADKALGYIKNNTNSGLPYLEKKGGVKAITLENLNKLLLRNDPCVFFIRTQENEKTRIIFGDAFADVLNDSRYYRVFLEYERNLPWRSAIVSPNAVDHSVTDIINKAKENDEELVSIDFDLFDTSFKRPLQKLVFDFIKHHFQLQYHEDINHCGERFGTVGLITPDGILKGDHGIPSGSAWTNTVGSIGQHLVASDFGVPDDAQQQQGDDGAYRVKNAKNFFDHFEKFGLKINRDKTYVSKDYLVYLQNLHDDYYRDSSGVCRGIYPTYRALGRFLFPERFTDFGEEEQKGSDFFALRAISLLENCCHHPLFYDFVKFIAKLDKYSLQFSQPGLSKYIQSLFRSNSVGDVFHYRRGDELKGIYNFKTVQILRELQKADTS